MTELDLRHSLIPDDLVEDLLSSMPPHVGPDLQEDRHRAKYDYITFMGRMTQGSLTPSSPVNEIDIKKMGHKSDGLDRLTQW